jgi:hypothetical protein
LARQRRSSEPAQARPVAPNNGGDAEKTAAFSKIVQAADHDGEQ